MAAILRAFLIGSPYRPIQYTRAHGTWQRGRKGRTIIHYVRNLKMERTHTERTHKHTGVVSLLLVMVVVCLGSGFCLTRMKINEKLFALSLLFAAVKATTTREQSSVAANNRATTTNGNNIHKGRKQQRHRRRQWQRQQWQAKNSQCSQVGFFFTTHNREIL